MIHLTRIKNKEQNFTVNSRGFIIHFILIFLSLFSIELISQEKDQIQLKQSELSDLKNEITALEAEINVKTRKEKESYSVLENFNRQNFLLNKIINNLREEEKQKEKEIARSSQEILSLEEEIKLLQENYARYIKAIYKNGKISEFAGLLDAESVEQAVLRYKYLQKFSESREKDLKKLELNKDKLIAAKKRLEEEKKIKSLLAKEKLEEEKKLQAKLDESKQILNKIRNDKSALRKELNAKKDAELKIKNLITRLIEEAERKKKEEAERLARLEKERIEKERISKTTPPPVTKTESKTISSVEYDIDLSTSGFSSFAALKGRLNWPIAGGKIIRKFGENKNSKLNTVTLNYGVDILTSKDQSVMAVAEGVVSAIDWIPGYGSVIIITHKDDYRTVYSHLSEIFVNEGDRVKMGSVIAKVNESLEGYILHFEIWNARNNQNPEAWLAKK